MARPMRRKQSDDPGFVASSVADQQEAVQICRTVYGGTLALRKEDGFLPQWEKEDLDHYRKRQKAALAIGSFRKTVRSLKAIVYRKPMSLGEDVPVEIRGDSERGIGGIVENIDLAGQHLDLFGQGLFLDKLVDGHSIILVDWHGPEGARRAADESNGRARPYWTKIQKGQVARPYVRRDDGALVLESFAYFEDDTMRSGAFAEKEIRRVRQFDLVDVSGNPFPLNDALPPPEGRRVLFRSWIQEARGGDWDVEEDGRLLGERMTRIPIAVDYAERADFMRSDPPFLDVALEVVDHMQIRSDRKNNMHVTSVPILQTFGIEPEELQVITIGTSMGLAFPGNQTEQGAGYAEAQGHGLEHTRTELQDIEKRIAELGLSALQRQSRAAETAEAHRLEQKAQDSELAAWAIGTRDAIEEALQLSAMWMGIEDGGGSVEINTDFEDMVMEPEQAKVYLKAVGEGRLSVETMWDAWVAGKYLPETFDPELEAERIAGEGTGELAAIAEEMRRLRQEQGAATGGTAGGEGDAA